MADRQMAMNEKGRCSKCGSKIEVHDGVRFHVKMVCEPPKPKASSLRPPRPSSEPDPEGVEEV